MTRIADDFAAIRRRLAELANKSEKLTTITPANSPLHPRTCQTCGTIQAYIVDRRCWLCPRCGTRSAP
jgi:transposase